MSDSEEPVPGGGQKLSWQCAAVGIVLLVVYGFLTTGRSILAAGGAASMAIAVVVFAGAVAGYGAFRGIDRASFTRPAVLNAVVLALVAPAAVRGWLISHRSSDALNVKRLNDAVAAYAQDHGGAYPSDLGVLFGRPGLPQAVFRRPGSSQPLPQDADDVRAGHCDYIYVYSGRPADGAIPVLCTRPGVLGSWINVAYSDATVAGVRANTVELATGVVGLEPAPPPPLPTIEEMKTKAREAREARQGKKVAPNEHPVEEESP